MVWKQMQILMSVPACQLESAIKRGNIYSKHCKRISRHVLRIKHQVFLGLLIIILVLCLWRGASSVVPLYTTLSLSERLYSILYIDGIAAAAKQILYCQIRVNHVIHVSITSPMGLKC